MNLAAGTPLWPSELTAWGTLALAAVTVVAILSTIVITRQDRQRTKQQLADERSAADKRLADEIKAADARLKTQIDHSDEQLRQERETAEARLQEERQSAQNQEQLTEAWSVEVFPASMPPEPGITSEPDQPIGRPVVIVINHGRYAITRVDARFSPDGISIVGRSESHASFDVNKLPFDLGTGLGGAIGQAYLGVLTPGTGVRFLGDTLLARQLRSTFPSSGGPIDGALAGKINRATYGRSKKTRTGSHDAFPLREIFAPQEFPLPLFAQIG